GESARAAAGSLPAPRPPVARSPRAASRPRADRRHAGLLHPADRSAARGRARTGGLPRRPRPHRRGALACLPRRSRDALVVTAAVLSQVFGGELETYTKVHWSGTHELTRVLERITTSADALLGAGLYARLKKLLARQGVKLGD